MRIVPAILLSLGAGVPVGAAQGVDYARANAFLYRHLEQRVYGDRVEVRWLEDGRQFWYQVKTPQGPQYRIVNPMHNVHRPLFDRARLAAALSLATDSAWEPHKLNLAHLELKEDRRAVAFVVGARQFRCDIVAYRCSAQAADPNREHLRRRSPDGRWEAFVNEHNLFIQPVKGGDAIQLTYDGEELRPYGVGWRWRPQPDLARYQVSAPLDIAWSPDSRRIAIPRADWRGVGVLPIYWSADTRPELWLYPFSLPGDSAVKRFDIHVLEVEDRTNVKLQSEQVLVMNDIGPTRDGTWIPVKWASDSERLFFVTANRGPSRLSLMVADPRTGLVRRLVSDSSAYTTVDTGSLHAASPVWRWTDRDEVFWYSTRDGWGHIYRFDGEGNPRGQITSGPWSVYEAHHADYRNRRLYFVARGLDPERFIYHRYLYRINFDGSGLRLLTPEPADHAIQFAPGGAYFIDTYSRFEEPPVTVLRFAEDGRVIRELERADVSRLAEIGWTPPELFRVTAADGVTDLYGILWKPTDFDTTKVYPLINYIYPNPIGTLLTWGFGVGDTHTQPQALRELGFIVMELMPRGTRGRSKAFLDAYHGRIGQNTLPDHVAAIRELAGRHRWIDVDRVGIYGFSGGGFASAAGILRYPELFKVAVSINGAHDMRSNLYFWGEKFHGLLTRDPATGTDNYQGEANYTYASRLKGKLLLVVGLVDVAVHPVNTLRLAHELTEANKRYDIVVFPNGGHNLSGPYLTRTVFDYFVRHLLGEEPPEYTFKEPDP